MSVELVISDLYTVREDIAEGLSFKTIGYRETNEEEKFLYRKAIEFVDNYVMYELALKYIYETDEYYDEKNIEAIFSCLIIKENEIYVELSESNYPIQHIRIDWDSDLEEFKLFDMEVNI